MNTFVFIGKFLALSLLVGFFSMLFARYSWIFDLFSHFAIQYAIGGFVLFILFIFLGRWAWAVPVLAVSLVSVYFIYKDVEIVNHTLSPDEERFTIVQYNKLFDDKLFSDHATVSIPGNKNYAAIGKWLHQNKDRYDVIFFQESISITVPELQKFKDIYLYQYPDTAEEQINDISVLSKEPLIISYESMNTNRNYNAAMTRVELKRDRWQKPLIIYSYHTHTPMTPSNHALRTDQMQKMAQVILNDDAPDAIALGDWNITPYSPYFSDFIRQTGLQYQLTSYDPLPTWPAPLFLPIFQIPIDHILHKGDLKLLNKYRGPAMGSDHYALVAEFGINTK